MMSETSGRTSILTRYRTLQRIAVDHNSAAAKYMSRKALFEKARRLGMLLGDTIVAESEEEMTLLYDLVLHAAQNGRSRPIDRYRARANFAPASDEAIVLDAMCQSRFSLWRVQERHAEAGLLVEDSWRGDLVWLVDEGLERSALPGTKLAMRLCRPAEFWIGMGVLVPLEEALFHFTAENLRFALSDEDGLVEDPRFVQAIYRAALELGAMEDVRHQ